MISISPRGQKGGFLPSKLRALFLLTQVYSCLSFNQGKEIRDFACKIKNRQEKYPYRCNYKTVSEKQEFNDISPRKYLHP